ncbi:hypothetical protein HQ587_02385 [bacterium]|nr:hypothetical protein [bacterium]
MKVQYSSSEPESKTPDKSESGKAIEVDRISVGHNSAEMYIKFGETIVILPPGPAKKLLEDLKQAMRKWESEHGKLPDVKDRKKKRRESVPKRVLKELYKSRKVGSKLISINTRKRKHLPFKDD